MKPILALIVSTALLCAFILVAAYETLFVGKTAGEQMGDEQ